MDSSTTPWRVFDKPAGATDEAQRLPDARAAGAGGADAINPWLAVAALVGALAIGVIAVVIAMAGAVGETIEGPAGGMLASHATADDGREIVVDVTGAVIAPGIYRLAPGSRVGDAIQAAGGFSPRVDAERVGRELNLAAPLADGAQVRVSSRDDPTAAPGGGGSPGGGAGNGAGSGLVNLNSASQGELEGLPGVGPVTAGKILASRADAQFTRVEELRERGLVGEKTFEAIRALVTVG